MAHNSRILSSIEDMSSILYQRRAKSSEIADIAGMKTQLNSDQWRERLAAAIEKSGKSYRSISLATKRGAGYVHSILKEDKDPTIDNLIQVCQEVGVSLSYIVYGYEVSPETEEILSLIEHAPQAREGILQILRSAQPSALPATSQEVPEK